MQSHSSPLDNKIDYTKLPGYNYRWVGLLFICVSLLIISLDNTILNVALPSISRDLGASASDLQWIIDAYVLVFAALLLTMGALGDRFGRKSALQVGIVWFGIGSLAAALSNSTEVLIMSRAFLGVGAAIIMPATLSLITAMFPPKERSQAIALWAAVFGLGVGIGPVIGGWLLERYSWNSVFFVNLPVVVTALIGGAIFLTNSKDETAPKIDIPGVLLSIPGLFALVYGIIEAGEKGWTSGEVLFAFGAAAVLIGAFAWWENRSPDAMLPTYFFKNMSFTGANTAIALVMFSLFGSVFFLSQFFQSVQGYTALEAGIRVVPLAMTLTVAAIFSARVSAKLGIKYTVALGIFIAGCGLLFMSQFYDVDTSYSTIVVGMIILASGMGTAMSPATDSVMGSIPSNKAGIGSAMNDTTRELGGAMGVAVLGTVMNTAYLDGIGSLQTTLSAMPDGNKAYEGVESSIQGAHVVAEGIGASGLPGTAELAQSIVNAANHAFTTGMTEAMLIGAIIMFCASVLVLLILPATIRRADDELVVEADDAIEGMPIPSPAMGD
jgi:EmrB/QacA subfamily drug resistance transporter